MSRSAFVTAAMLSCALSAQAGFITIDFETDDLGAPLTNGQEIESPDEFGAIVSIRGAGGNSGAAIFDTDPMGPNVGGPDEDLLVGLGNILILQSSASTHGTQTVPGFFDVPNDSSNGGRLLFDFVTPTELVSIDVVDVDDDSSMIVTLIDSMGLRREYTLAEGFTNDILIAPSGFDTLDLTTLASQVGEGGGIATATEDLGFDATSVSRLQVRILGSGGVDNLTLVPTPGSAALMGLAGLASMRRRR